jgi:hypothetical protein
MAQINIRTASWLMALLLIAMTTSGCEVIEGIFKAGVWVGVILVVVVVGLLFAIFGRKTA